MIIDELYQLRSMVCERIRLEERIEFLDSLTKHTTADITSEKVQSSGSGDSSDKIIRLMDVKQKLKEHKADIELQLFKIEDYINALPSKYKEIINLRYIDGLAWKTVATRTYRTVDSCFKLQRQAFKMLKEMENNKNV